MPTHMSTQQMALDKLAVTSGEGHSHAMAWIEALQPERLRQMLLPHIVPGLLCTFRAHIVLGLPSIFAEYHMMCGLRTLGFCRECAELRMATYEGRVESIGS